MEGRLEFDRNHVSMAFKRAQFVLYDVKYLLGSLPTTFDDDLRKGFLHGLSLMLNLLVMMQGMDSVVRQLIEPVLCTMAMIAQVHAGMWRRNGFALLNQLYFYHNVKCRTEMFDRDVVMLQIGASLIESNEFMIHVLNKFNLLDWAAADFEQKPIEDDTLRHTISMVEEFLGLLITVVGSRYVPGVGEVCNEERTKKEIIQMLCVKPMPHSELNRALPEDQLHETGLEAVIHEVADFVKPSSGNNRGVYKLKPHLFDDYDTFFYHYTREELSRSEEEQRNRRKSAGK
ncbi:jg6386 [Pararge aegeria aegeria]|uniref:E3 ubiquitin-protein ligase n=1 Tax=Pararge aegeria aegeria TaxID=348720 RepID=A0A8S4RPB9_9NEOP|nr:jg6386 [Pararge aegeria aegeria]